MARLRSAPGSHDEVVGKTRIADTLDASQAAASDAVPSFGGAVGVFGRWARWAIDGCIPVEDHYVASTGQQGREGTKRSVVDFVEHVQREDAVVRRSRLRLFPTCGAEIFEA